MASVETYYRTAKFKVHDPSGRKLRRLQRMQDQYSAAYSDLMWALQGQEEQIASFIDAGPTEAKNIAEELLDGIPIANSMQDGLIRDAQESLSSYLEGEDAEHPAPAGQHSKSVDDLLEDLLAVETKEEEDLLKAELKRKDKHYTRPITYVRFRDCPIIRSDDGEKLWVAPKLGKRKDGKTSGLPENADWIRGSGYTRTWTKKRECLPIECGQWHMHRFFKDGKPTSCRIEVTEDDIWVHYAFEFETEVEYDAKEQPVLGIDRGRAITAAYSVVDREGNLLEEGSSASEQLREKLRAIDKRIDEAQKRGENPSPYWDKRRNIVQDALHRIGNRIIKTARRHNASIAFEDLENLNGGKNLNRRQYRRLMKFVQYRAKEHGLWAEIEVHPAYTSRTCPHCGHHHKNNRGGKNHPSLTRDEFECQECGYQAHSDLNAGRLIALRALWQTEGGKSKTQCQTLMEFVRDRSQVKPKDRPEHSSGPSATESTPS